jgi:hypothetical protein
MADRKALAWMDILSFYPNLLEGLSRKSLRKDGFLLKQ